MRFQSNCSLCIRVLIFGINIYVSITYFGCISISFALQIHIYKKCAIAQNVYTYWYNVFLISFTESDKPSNGESKKPSNNLNREDSQETVPYTKNIDNTQTTDTRTNDEIPLEEMQRLIAEASKELDVDAHKALEDLQKDKDIMKRLQEVKNKKKEDVNKGTKFNNGQSQKITNVILDF